MTGITWIASYPKSGNTWLRLFLANLFVDGPEPVSINSIGRFTFSDSDLRLYRKLVPDISPEIPITRQIALRPQAQRLLTGIQADYVFCKTHWPHVGTRGRPMFDVKSVRNAVYLLRDPRDVAVSFAHHHAGSYDDMVNALIDARTASLPNETQLREYYADWAHHVNSWTACRDVSVLVLRYEDMLGDPEASFRRCVEFLGFPADAERVRRAAASSQFDIARAQERTRGFIETPPSGQAFFRDGRTGAWRECLTEQQVHRLEAAFGSTMQAHGYVPEVAPLTATSDKED